MQRGRWDSGRRWDQGKQFWDSFVEAVKRFARVTADTSTSFARKMNDIDINIPRAASRNSSFTSTSFARKTNDTDTNIPRATSRNSSFPRQS